MWRRGAAAAAAAAWRGVGEVAPCASTSSTSAALPSSLRTHATLAVRGVNPIRSGPGGRSSISGVEATVFGCTGFLGRYVVNELATRGTRVLVPYRGNDEEVRHLKLMGDLGQIVPVHFNPKSDESIRRTIKTSNVVINCIGRDFPTKNYPFETVHVEVAERIARMCAGHGNIDRLMHVSCLKASLDAPAQSLVTKAKGEQAVLSHFPRATILKPAHMFGVEDRLLNAFAIFFKKLGVVPIYNGGWTKMQPVHARDVAAAVMGMLGTEASVGQTYELGGPETFTIKDLVNITFETIREKPVMLNLPIELAQWLAAPREWAQARVPFPINAPLLLLKDYMDTLKVDHVVSPDALGFKDLGLEPRRMAGINIDYLLAYRVGGPDHGTTADHARV